MFADSSGDFTVPDPGRTGTTTVNCAREVNGNSAVPVGAIVRLTPGSPVGVSLTGSQEYLFAFAPAPHTLLSATHTDTIAGTVVRGDVITGQGATPAWDRLAKGSADQVVGYDATDVVKITPSGGGPVVGTGRTITAGDNLTGGGSLAADRVIDLDPDIIVDTVVIGGTESTVPLAGATPTARLAVHDDGTSDLSAAYLTHNATAAAGPELVIARSRGTEATKSVVSSGDRLGQITFAGHDGTDYERGVTIRAEVAATPGSGDMPAKLIIATTPDASATPVDRVTVGSAGDLTLGTDGYLVLDEHSSAPATPASGTVAVYAKSDGILYTKDDAGTETVAGGAGGGDTVQYRHTGTSRYYVAGVVVCTALSNTVMTADVLYAVPLMVPRAVTIDRIGVNVTGAGTAAARVRVGIYTATSVSNLYPDALVSGSDGGELNASSTGMKENTVSVSLAAGLYFAVFQTNEGISVLAFTQGVSWNVLGSPTDIANCGGGGLERGRCIRGIARPVHRRRCRGRAWRPAPTCPRSGAGTARKPLPGPPKDLHQEFWKTALPLWRRTPFQ